MLDGLYDFDVPVELQAVVQRHQKHVADLVANLRSFGMDESSIERNVDQLIASYRAELMEAAKALRGLCHA